MADPTPVVKTPAALAAGSDGFTADQVQLIKDTVAKGTTNDQLKLFLIVSKRTGLDPFSNQIYCVTRGGRMTIQTGIDGYRAIAVRTGQLAGIDDAIFDDESAKHPKKATVTVHRMIEGVARPFTASARWDEYAQSFNGQLGSMWQKMPFLMLAKCAEALALRKAFPNDLSGIYTSEEMDQATGAPKISGSVEVEEPAPAGAVDTADKPAPIEGEIVTPAAAPAPAPKPESAAAAGMRAGREAQASKTGTQLRCPFCDKLHGGSYPKCRECWQAERDGATLTPAPKKKTLVNTDAPPF